MPYWRLYYHVVWTTRGRQPLITDGLEFVIHREIREAALRHAITVHAVGGTDDHVHVVVSIPPSMSVATAVGRLKGASSHAANAVVGAAFAWEAEYGVLSFAERSLTAVCGYVADQRRHHADGTLRPALEQIAEPAEIRKGQPASAGFVP